MRWARPTRVHPDWLRPLLLCLRYFELRRTGRGRHCRAAAADKVKVLAVSTFAAAGAPLAATVTVAALAASIATKNLRPSGVGQCSLQAGVRGVRGSGPH